MSPKPSPASTRAPRSVVSTRPQQRQPGPPESPAVSTRITFSGTLICLQGPPPEVKPRVRGSPLRSPAASTRTLSPVRVHIGSCPAARLLPPTQADISSESPAGRLCQGQLSRWVLAGAAVALAQLTPGPGLRRRPIWPSTGGADSSDVVLMRAWRAEPTDA